MFTLTVTVQSLVYWDVVDNICQEWHDGFCCRLTLSNCSQCCIVLSVTVHHHPCHQHRHQLQHQQSKRWYVSVDSCLTNSISKISLQWFDTVRWVTKEKFWPVPIVDHQSEWFFFVRPSGTCTNLEWSRERTKTENTLRHCLSY